ncbi:hypothetical protein [Bradyrhizobium retamae]|nr:hypothetical protein [Bradyrhizobium retamae]
MEESESTSLPVPAKSNGKWMSLENAGTILAERVTGQSVAKPSKARAEVTVREAAKQIERSDLETPAELSELRGRRLVATAASFQCWQELEDFINRATHHFQGQDEATLAADPQYREVCAYAQQLRARYDAAYHEATDVWTRQCLAENEVFEAGRPDWKPEDARRVAALLDRLGVSEQEREALWLTPEPINVASPICMTLAQLAVGADNPDPIQAALGAVGFDDGDINAVISGEMPIYLRDHRIQELVARAADVDTQAKNRAAA